MGTRSRRLARETAGDVTPQCFTRNAVDYLFSQANPQISWTYYAAGQGSLWVAPNSLSNICIPQAGVCTGPDWVKGASNGFVDTTPPDVLNDIANCALSQVTWITPAGQYSDHPINSGQGPSWVAAIVNAIGSNTGCDGGAGYWKDTAIFITWDDWGGWYDHVRPIFQTGCKPERLSTWVSSAAGGRFRISPKTAYISNQEYDFGSIVKAIEGIFGLGSLGFADARAANDLHDFLQLQTARNCVQNDSSSAGGNLLYQDQGRRERSAGFRLDAKRRKTSSFSFRKVRPPSRATCRSSRDS